MHPLLERLRRGPLLADGAVGTMLHARGAPLEACLEELNLSQPDWVRELHLAYLKAGADLIQTNTFGAGRPRLEEVGLGRRVRDIVFRGVKLAREAREISGQSAWIGGSVGPLGRRARSRDGRLHETLVRDAFREFTGVLWEAGCDAVIIETFSDLDELALAVEAARETDLPVIAEMTFGNEGVTALGATPAEVAHALAALGVDVGGVNCSQGPARVLDAIVAMHEAEPGLTLSAMPNAGFPFQSGDRIIYPTSPIYFAHHVEALLANGVLLAGGCCGTTPAHTQAMREAVDAAVPAAKGSPQPALPMVREPVATPSGPEEAPPLSGLLQKIQSGSFAISVEVDPPRGFNPEKMIEGARIARERGADAVNVADSPMARVRMGALALCALIQQQVDIETVLHFTTRDRSLMALQSDLLGAHALGVRNILALTGDPPTLGDQPDSKPVYDVDSVGLIHILARFNEGLDRSGKAFGSRAGYTIICACDPTRPDLDLETDRFHRKVSAGAHFTMSQPIFDVDVWRRFYRLYEERHGPFPVPVLIGILPLQSHRHATFLHNEVPGITLSEPALHRMEQAGADGRREGVKMAQELLLELKDEPGVRGVYLMPSFGRYEVACEVLDVLQREE